MAGASSVWDLHPCPHQVRCYSKAVFIPAYTNGCSQDRIRTCTKRGHLPLMGHIPSPSVLPYHVASTNSATWLCYKLTTFPAIMQSCKRCYLLQTLPIVLLCSTVQSLPCPFQFGNWLHWETQPTAYLKRNPIWCGHPLQCCQPFSTNWWLVCLFAWHLLQLRHFLL